MQPTKYSKIQGNDNEMYVTCVQAKIWRFNIGFAKYNNEI